MFRPNHMIYQTEAVEWVEHPRTHHNERGRWVSLPLNPSYRVTTSNHLNASEHWMMVVTDFGPTHAGEE